MSFAHLGYPVVTSQPQAPVTPRSSPKSPSSTGGMPCCETGRPIITDPVSGQTICSCQYGNPAVSAAAAFYPRFAMGGGGPLPEALYSPAAMAAQLQIAAGATDPSAIAALYSGLTGGNPYEFKGLPPTGLYPYDPTLAAYPYAAGFLDPNARRKNATRESTQTLKAWLTEHKKNPYPTKGEKIMLAIITKMTLTQVSTWFANARRRLKKENKMTWEPRNRMDDEDDDDINSDIEADDKKDGEEENISVDSDDDDSPNPLRLCNPLTASLAHHPAASLPPRPNGAPGSPRSDTEPGETKRETISKDEEIKRDNNMTSPKKTDPENKINNIVPAKPKIWSMAEIATSSQSKNESERHSTNNNRLSPHVAGKIPSMMSQGLHPAWRGTHPYLHPHFAQRLAAFPGGPHLQHRQQFPAFTSLPQLRHTDATNHMSAFSPPASASSPSAQAQRNA